MTWSEVIEKALRGITAENCVTHFGVSGSVFIAYCNSLPKISQANWSFQPYTREQDNCRRTLLFYLNKTFWDYANPEEIPPPREPEE